MKKIILAGVVSSLLSAAAFAAPATLAAAGPIDGGKDVTSATLTWKAEVPVIVPGQWVTFTGKAGSMTLDDADLNVKADGTFKSEPIVLELHTYDADTNTPGELIALKTDQFGGVGVDSISYQVKAPEFSSKLGTDVTKVESKILLDGTEVEHDAAIPSTAVETTWSLEGSDVGTMIGGDVITAQTVVIADVTFAKIGA
ncbi:hypothetical protein [Vibrio campbellii]|uniref:hypothetical protein n=1 Tax=Vibrio campbellii TaxID=680 RepID=UPI0005EEA6A9|nr:hypothetical protein [Vibrio campbellii]